MRSLVYGLAVTGASTVRALTRRGHEVVVVDDHVDDAKRDLAGELGIELLPTPVGIDAFVARFDLVSPSPGVPESHGVIAAARRHDVPVRSEIELAYQWEQARPGGARPILAVTGTDGKTTTCLLAAAMLTAAGVRTIAAGNTDVPLVDALEMQLDAYVVECSSFRLAWTEQFRADAALWLNLAPDHLNWHRSTSTYEAAKARIFDLQRPSDVAIGYVDDPIVMRHLATAPARHVTFGRSNADYCLAGDALCAPTGTIVNVDSMRRRLPHDITNALAASALVIESGLGNLDAAGRAIASFVGPPHRIEPVGERDGVQWFNDSKATTPHAAAVAIRGFEHVVLIAGGRNKGLDLAPMAAEPQRLRSVVAIGESASEISDLFTPHCAVVRADSMEAAVVAAADSARRGDAVLLSPGCASFDWYPNGGYVARGDHFRRLVADMVGGRRVDR